MKLRLLRLLLLVDAAILFVLGALFIGAPGKVELAFKFHDLPDAVGYLIGLWGCVFATMAMGYAVAASNPLKHRVWAQVGIARGALECLLGLVYLARGFVTFQQAGFGIIVAGLMALAYGFLYPGKPRLVAPSDQAANTPATS
jgi:hypothetical protein